MTGFDLPQNIHSNPESHLRRVRPCIVPPPISPSAAEPVIASSLASQAMAQKTLRDYSAPSANQVPTGPEVNTGGENFEIKTVSLRWCRPALSVARPMRMPALISSSSWSSAVLCYQGCIGRCNSAPSVSVLSVGESEVMVLC